MTKSYAKAKGRNRKVSYVGFPRALINTRKYRSLSAHAVKLLLDLGSQYNGFNNGDLCLAWTLMVKVNWKSRSTLYKARKELIDVGFIMLTRQGGKNRASLYAITWNKIDQCKGKLDVSPTKIAPGYWFDTYKEN